ncbi:MAG TPA: HAMP domain-containing sensor histidine kinase, partial [Terriglobales bacterium]|nr:HAMP domain-containing sensor histidine kinase [Terriglobales bacterium]
DAAGRIIGASKIARDVTERKLAEAEQARLLAAERRARAQAEAAIRSKDEFLSVISHELRTPLAAILGWVNVLKSGVSGEKAAKALSTIERSGRAQAKLIEDLLDVSRIITGRMRLDLRLTDLPAVISQAIDTVRPTADAKRVNLTSHCDPSAGPVVGDVDRLQQIVWNLLSNAIKFTPSGGSVELRLSRQRSHVRLTVTDTGRGIERDFLPFIFERFSQADRADSRRHGGLGLGLAIVRHLAELHGGMVSVQSEGEGKGSTFTVTLPLASADVEIDADTSVGGQTSHDCE